jgi:hypothetical protein
VVTVSISWGYEFKRFDSQGQAEELLQVFYSLNTCGLCSPCCKGRDLDHAK